MNNGQHPPSMRQFYAVAVAVSTLASSAVGGIAWKLIQVYLHEEPWVVELETNSDAMRHDLQHLTKLSPGLEKMLEDHKYLLRRCAMGDKPRDECRILGLPTPNRSRVVLGLPSAIVPPTEGGP